MGPEVVGRPDDQQQPGLRAKTLRSVLWTSGQSIAVRLLSLVTFAVLARLLTPADYGIAALAGVFAALFSLLAAGGFTPTLVQKADIDDADVDTVFWVSVATSAVLTVLMIAAAWPLAAVMRAPELAWVLVVLSPTFLAVGFGSTPAGLLQREHDFARLARIGVASNVAATVLGISLAVAGAGYWALVAQMVGAPVLTSVLLWRGSVYRPGRRASRERFGEIFRTSRYFLGDNLMTFATEQVDKFLVGRSLGTGVLGVYSVAYRIVFLLLEILGRSVQVVALSSFSRVQDDRGRLAAGYLSAVRLCALVAWPCFAFVGIQAGPLVSTVFGDTWLPGVPTMQVFCAYGAVQAMITLHKAFLQAVGRSRTVLWLAVGGTVVQIIAIVLALPYGIEWVAAGFLLRGCVMLPVLLVFVGRELGVATVGRALMALAPPALATAALAGAVVGVTRWVDAGPFVTLLASAPAGGAALLVVLALIGRRHLAELRGLGRSVR